MRIEITTEGMDELMAKLRRMDAKHLIRPALAAAALQLTGYMREYPASNRLSRKAVYGQAFVSDRQRRKVMAMIRNGEIPYTRGSNGRSERLGAKWTHTMRSNTEAVVGNSASYAPLVMGAGMQSQYMAAVGWRTAQDIAKEREPEITQAFGRAVLQFMMEVGL